MSSQRVWTWSTAQPDPLWVHFSRVSCTLGNAWWRAALISLFWRTASCLWRRTGSVYSSLPSGLAFSRSTLRASWNFSPPLRALSSSSSFFWIRSSASSRKALGSAPCGCPLGTSICQPLKKFPSAHGVCLKTSSSVLASFLSKEKSRMSSRYCSFGTADLKDLCGTCASIGSNSSSRAFLFLSFALRDGGEGRYFPGCKGFNKRALTESWQSHWLAIANYVSTGHLMCLSFP